MNYTKDDLISRYKEIKKKLGHPPSSTEYRKEAPISQRTIGKFFGSNAFAKLAAECGDTPNKFSKEKSNFDEICTKYGQLYRELKKHPTEADWIYYDHRPSVNGITKSHKINWADMPIKFLEFASNKDEWSDVIDLIPNTSINSLTTYNKIEGLSYERLKFIPLIIQDLVELSTNEDEAIEFEKKVNLAFQMLGFEVTGYGQGTGRNPDGIAKSNQHRYAILIDSKSRKDAYKIGTEDRKFIEYIKNFEDPLRKSGYSKIYFLIVSSKFDSAYQTSVNKIKLKTQVSTTFLSSKSLLKILAKKIEIPRVFDLDKFQELLINDGEISDAKVDKFITGLK